jgi:hypothetical protein
MNPKTTEHSRIIDAIGGTGEVAKLCEVLPSAVSQWRTDGIPRARLMYLRLIRPDVFNTASRKRVAAK